MPDQAARYDVFLSHNSADKPAVEEIARRLVAAGLQPFLDKWHLIPGQPWHGRPGERAGGQRKRGSLRRAIGHQSVAQRGAARRRWMRRSARATTIG